MSRDTTEPFKRGKVGRKRAALYRENSIDSRASDQRKRVWAISKPVGIQACSILAVVRGRSTAICMSAVSQDRNRDSVFCISHTSLRGGAFRFWRLDICRFPTKIVLISLSQEALPFVHHNYRDIKEKEYRHHEESRLQAPAHQRPSQSAFRVKEEICASTNV
jgi:hypothetical protein